jgi:transposase
MLAAKGMSTREIAELTGWSHVTIANDLKTVKKLTETVKERTARPTTARGAKKTKTGEQISRRESFVCGNN